MDFRGFALIAGRGIRGCIYPALLLLIPLCHARQLSNIDRERGHLMLKFVRQDIAQNYYDRNFHGVNVDERFRQADRQIDSAINLNQMFWDIGETLLDLNDWHTVFVPPIRNNTVKYGWDMLMVGDTCMVTAVQPGSDAEAKGLRPGTIIGAINRVPTTRFSLPYIQYIIHFLMPQPTIQVSVLDKKGLWNDLTIEATVTRRSRTIDLTDNFDYWNFQRELERIDRVNRSRLTAYGDKVVVWKLPEFDLDDKGLEACVDKVRGKRALILDLRDNPGGYETTLSHLAGYLFDRDLTLFYTKTRQKTDSVVAPHQEHSYDGKVIVLVNSGSASSSEIFARTIQLTKRGTVVGDITEGVVAEAQFFKRELGASSIVVYGTNITIGSVTMPDGYRLEGSGVVPDQEIIPTSYDLQQNLDPVLAHALESVGVNIDARQAADLFPIEWTN